MRESGIYLKWINSYIKRRQQVNKDISGYQIAEIKHFYGLLAICRAMNSVVFLVLIYEKIKKKGSTENTFSLLKSFLLTFRSRSAQQFLRKVGQLNAKCQLNGESYSLFKVKLWTVSYLLVTKKYILLAMQHFLNIPLGVIRYFFKKLKNLFLKKCHICIKVK